jgi:hypothetical protein
VYVTTNYLGVKQGSVNYLFFLLTEDYIEENKIIQSSLDPLFKKFGKELGAAGAIVRPRMGNASENLSRVINNQTSDEYKWNAIHGHTPALLIIDTDLERFRPEMSEHIIISLRDSMDEFGNVKVFEVDEMLNMLASAAQDGTVFSKAREMIDDRKRKKKNEKLSDSVQLKPSMFGIGLDLKQAIQAFRRK